jgi:hypothetical protein
VVKFDHFKKKYQILELIELKVGSYR